MNAPLASIVEATAGPHLDAWIEALGDDDPRRALELLRRFQILCGPRQGARGVAALQSAVERALNRRGLDTASRHYHGRPVIVTANDHAQKLFNGDVGLCWRSDHSTQIVLPTVDSPREVPLHRVPPHDTGWALTVHKSQGSEYHGVVLVLPEATSALATRDLIYTAITRARDQVTLVGSNADLVAACERAVVRTSRLAELIG